jgi:hypothetical protein
MSQTKPIIDLIPSELINQPYSEDETLSLEQKVENLLKFFNETGIAYDKVEPVGTWDEGLDLKKAYPNYDQYMHVPGQHDTQKWLQAVKDIYYREKNGANRVQSIRQATSGWNLMETYDFLNWLRFYESGVHLKYKTAHNKTAQVWYENGSPGYFLHIKPDPPAPQFQSVQGRDVDDARDSTHSELSNAEKKHIIEKQRSKIIGRLDSAEKLLRSPDGQMFAGKELEALMEAIYNLKKKIQLVNKLSSSTRIYEDMIVREGNVLSKRGFVKAAASLYALADDPALTPTPPNPPQQGSGSAGGLPSVGPGMAQNPPDSAPNNPIMPQSPPESPPEPPQSKGLGKFLENMDTAKITTKDDLEVDDTVEVNETDDELFVTEAQAIPDAAPMPDAVPMPAAPSPELAKAPAGPAGDKSLEVTEDDVESGLPKDVPTKDFDNMIDAAFANLTVNDVVAKLEDLAKIFKTREVPRQLAIVDMMLDSLGMATFFPSLSEATNKALESNNYISTRIEDIISKLRGAMETKDIDLRGAEHEQDPAVQKIKQNLTDSAEKEKTRKEMRKQQENMELEAPGKETPDVEIEEDLGGKAPPAPKPVAPPAAPVA